MSTQTIYKQLINAGMSKAGACGLMGNMNAESAMRANNAQDGMTRHSDEEYTRLADQGESTRTINGVAKHFHNDEVGYGLCQWTYWTRKQALLNFAKQKGVSIGDEAMQVEFAIQELKTGYPGLWSFLCTTDNVHDAAGRVCTEFERPAVNNITARASAGLRFFEELTDEPKAETSVPTTPSTPSTSDAEEVVEVQLKVLKKGAKGDQVKALQTFLRGADYDLGRTGIDGDFGPVTDSCVRKFQSRNGLKTDGSVGPATWKKMLGV